MKNKILVFTDEDSIHGDIDHIQHHEIPVVNSIIAEIKELNIGPATSELVQNALYCNSSQIKDLFEAQALTDIQSIKSPVLRQNLLSGIDEALNQFRKFVSDSVGQCDRDLLRNTSVENETAILTDQDKENIAEKYRRYLSPEENTLYQLQVKCCDMLNQIFSAKDSATVHSILYLFEVQDGKFAIRNDVNFGYLMNQE